MGFFYPIYNIPPSLIDNIIDKCDQIVAKYWTDEKSRANVTYRPLRPNEINIAFTPATRVYDTTKTVVGYERILGAAADIIVPTGSMYAIFGWLVIDDPTSSIGFDAVGQILVDTVIRNEIALMPINVQPGNVMLTLEQTIVAEQNQSLAIQFKSPVNAVAHAIVYPIGVRIGPKNQLDVS